MTIEPRHRAVLAAVAMLVLLVAACGGSSTDRTPTATATLIPTATSVAPAATTEAQATPRPTSTPYTVVEPPATGRIHTTISISCTLGAYGVEIHVSYDISVLDTDNPAATLTGIKLYIDGVLREDTGPMSSKTFVRQSTFPGIPLRLHTLQLHVDTWAAPHPRDLVQFAQCPAAPDKPVA